MTKEKLMENHQLQTQKSYDAMLDRYRDNNWMPVYKCPVCGVRGVGPIVTLHEHTMIRETK